MTNTAYGLTCKLAGKVYADRWFRASTFFNTQDSSELVGNHFITHDYFLKSDIYALRRITREGIQTVLQSSDRKEVEDKLQELTKEKKFIY